MTDPVRGYAVALALLVSLTACGSKDEGDPPTSGSTTNAAAPDWNPCRELAAGPVSDALLTRVTKETGTSENPRCAFLPAAKGGPTLNVTYLWFDGGFEQAWTSMGQIDGTVTDLRLDGADAARLVVNTTRKAVLVTGFVQTGRLIETVNAIELRPYDRSALVDATTHLMARLVARAPASPDEAAARG